MFTKKLLKKLFIITLLGIFLLGQTGDALAHGRRHRRHGNHHGGAIILPYSGVGISIGDPGYYYYEGYHHRRRYRRRRRYHRPYCITPGFYFNLWVPNY